MPRLIISTLPPTPAALGFLCRFVGEFKPFQNFELGTMVKTLQYQLETSNHLVGGQNDEVVAYLGWIRTSRTIAEAWMTDSGPLNPAPDADAVAITVLTARNRSYILPMVREAKRLNPTYSVYWKRHLSSRPGFVSRYVRKSAL